MINPVNAPGNVSTSLTQTPEAQAPPAQTKSAGDDQATTKSDIRLFIEEDPDTHTYVYRLVDSATGKVLVEIPREQLSTLAAESPEAGALIGLTA